MGFIVFRVNWVRSCACRTQKNTKRLAERISPKSRVAPLPLPFPVPRAARIFFRNPNRPRSASASSVRQLLSPAVDMLLARTVGRALARPFLRRGVSQQRPRHMMTTSQPAVAASGGPAAVDGAGVAAGVGAGAGGWRVALATLGAVGSVAALVASNPDVYSVDAEETPDDKTLTITQRRNARRDQSRELIAGVKNMLIFSGRANVELAQEVVDYLGIKLGNITVSRFADGEVKVQVNENVRGKDIYIFQPTCPPVNENLMELLLMVSTMRRASAKRITVIIPYYGYARQDRKMTARVPIAAADVARLLEAMGVDRVVAVDLHCGQIQGFFGPRVPVDNLDGVYVGVEYFSQKGQSCCNRGHSTRDWSSALHCLVAVAVAGGRSLSSVDSSRVCGLCARCGIAGGSVIAGVQRNPNSMLQLFTRGLYPTLTSPCSRDWHWRGSTCESGDRVARCGWCVPRQDVPRGHRQVRRGEVGRAVGRAVSLSCVLAQATFRHAWGGLVSVLATQPVSASALRRSPVLSDVH
jgi:hypothetical protein